METVARENSRLRDRQGSIRCLIDTAARQIARAGVSVLVSANVLNCFFRRSQVDKGYADDYKHAGADQKSNALAGHFESLN